MTQHPALAVLGAGFWLSFAGVAWLLWCLPADQGPRRWAMLHGFVAAQAVATLGLLPLTVLLFGQASFAGPIANLAAVPWWSLVVVPLALIGVLAETLHTGLGQWAWQAAAWCFDLLWPALAKIADSPLARMRMSAWAAAYLVQKDVGLEAVLHFPTRGRNLLRIQGDLLASHAMGIRNLFVTMGDPTRIGDYPEAMDSYDIVPTGLIELIKKQFNQGLDKAGLSIDQPTTFVVGCALSLTPKDVEAELKLLRKKVEHGADFALTQPVFDPEAALAFIAAYERAYGEPPPPILAGIKPLYNSRNAEFLHNEVPGIIIPEPLRERMRAAAKPQAEGVAIAREIAAALRPRVNGFYFMPAFGRYDLVADVLDMFQ